MVKCLAYVSAYIVLAACFIPAESAILSGVIMALPAVLIDEAWSRITGR
jgi:hypothetical protein